MDNVREFFGLAEKENLLKFLKVIIEDEVQALEVLLDMMQRKSLGIIYREIFRIMMEISIIVLNLSAKKLYLDNNDRSTANEIFRKFGNNFFEAANFIFTRSKEEIYEYVIKPLLVPTAN